MAHRDIVVLHNELISNQEITFDLPQKGTDLNFV